MAAKPDPAASLLGPETLARIAGRSLTLPLQMTRQAGKLSRDLVDVALGRAEVDPAHDRRFTDEAFATNPILRTWAQSYLTWRDHMYQLVDEVDANPRERAALRLAAAPVVEGLAPTNSLAGNPAAAREAVETRGSSLVRGAGNFTADLIGNGGLPRTVDTEPFVVGETIAATPGSVVHRDEMFELIQYAPTTETVSRRPIVVIPPQINRYYVLDLAPGRSMVEHAVAQGHQVFMVSWKNPGPDQRDWDLDGYVAAVSDAIDVALDITGSEDCNICGVCAGGMTTAATLGYLAATSDRRVNAATLVVTVLDWSVPSSVSAIMGEPGVARFAELTSQSEGILSGRRLSQLFTWLRPNDLVWNYWVNNYLMGRQPAAFDVLAWNADATNLPAALHRDFLDIATRNALCGNGDLTVLGEKVDLASVTCDALVIGAETDHITPWEACYATLGHLGGATEFVLSSSGHVQALVNPPGNPKARYRTNPGRPEQPEEWLAGSTEHTGSWWEHWMVWLAPRAGEQVPAPRRLGSTAFPVVDAAPGRYVHE